MKIIIILLYRMKTITFILFLDLAIFHRINDLTNGPGIVSVKTENGFMINKYYTYVHSINMTLVQETLYHIEDLINNYNITKTPTTYIDSVKTKVIKAFLNNLKERLQYAQNKLDHISLNK